MQERRREALLTLAERLGLSERRYFVDEWIKAPGARRGHRRRKLKIYWVKGEILHSGPFYSRDEALLFLEGSTYPQMIIYER